MGKNRNNREAAAPEAPAAETQEPTTPDVVTEETVVAAAPKRLPLALARDANFGKTPDPENLTPAAVVQTAKGTNPGKERVYGYDTTDGKVPKAAVIALVPGFVGCPKGVQSGQWALLQEYAGKTVEVAYDNGVESRTVRRAYRGNAVRFIAA